MAAMGVADMALQCCVFEGSMSLHDTEIDRMPYHRFCSCALHKSKGALVSNSSCFKERKVSFPWKAKSGSTTSLSIAASKVSSQSWSSRSHWHVNKKERTTSSLKVFFALKNSKKKRSEGNWDFTFFSPVFLFPITNGQP